MIFFRFSSRLKHARLVPQPLHKEPKRGGIKGNVFLNYDSRGRPPLELIPLSPSTIHRASFRAEKAAVCASEYPGGKKRREQARGEKETAFASRD